MSSKILVAASSKSAVATLASAIKPLRRGILTALGPDEVKNWDSVRLVVCELGPRIPTVEPFLKQLRPDAHVILIVPKLDVLSAAMEMRDARINHLLARPADAADVAAIGEKLASGAIFGLERTFPTQTEIVYQRLRSFKDRCDALEKMDEYLTTKRIRRSFKTSAIRAVEELLMNAMYQAPVSDKGQRLFANVSPKMRLRRRTPRPVSLRYAVNDRSIYVCVRDRYGSLKRDDLVNYLHHCATTEQQIEQKQLGAGLGLYLVASTVTRLAVNLLPGGVTEMLCSLEPLSGTEGESRLKLFSFTAQRPLIPAE